MNVKDPEALRNRFSLTPRCCDWCDKRGLLTNPLHRLYVQSDRLNPGTPEDYFWWVHSECASILLEDETISAWWQFGPIVRRLK